MPREARSVPSASMSPILLALPTTNGLRSKLDGPNSGISSMRTTLAGPGLILPQSGDEKTCFSGKVAKMTPFPHRKSRQGLLQLYNRPMQICAVHFTPWQDKKILHIKTTSPARRVDIEPASEICSQSQVQSNFAVPRKLAHEAMIQDPLRNQISHPMRSIPTKPSSSLQVRLSTSSFQ